MGGTIKLPTDWEAELQKTAGRQGKTVLEILRYGVLQSAELDSLPEAESKLLRIISTPFPTDARQKSATLRALQSERDLSDAERAELTDAIDTLEIANAQRWQAIVELAERRGQSLVEIARELVIPPPSL